MADRDRREVNVRAALASLPDLERRAVVLAYYQAVPHGQLAKALSTSQPVALACLHRGTRTLQEILARGA